MAPLVPIALFSLLLFSGATGRIRDGIYDLFCRIRPSPAAAREILLVDVDDAAVSAEGAWPWSRGILADGLVVMKEMEARTAVFTFPFPRQSAPGIDASALQSGIPAAFDKEFSRIEDNIQSLFNAIRLGSVPPGDSPRYVAELIGLVAAGKIRLLEEVTGIERDDDVHLGQAAQFFGGTYLPLELIPSADPAVARDVEERAIALMALRDVEVTHDRSLRAAAVRPPVLPILRGARGGGFADLPSDADGVYRRAALTAEYKGGHFAQIAFSAAIDRLGGPLVVLDEHSLSLRTAASQGRAAKELSLPLGRDGRLLIDWPRVPDGDGFRHLSWAGFTRDARLETELLSSLRDMERSGYLSYHRSESSLLDLYQYAENLLEEMLAGGSTEKVSEWREARERFFDAARGFLEGDAESRIVSDADKALSSQKLSDEERRGIREVRDRVPTAFTYARGTLTDLMRIRASLRESLRGSLCIVALSASPQAVSGRTPAGHPATDGLASAALANGILSGRVLREVPTWALIALAAGCSLLAAAAVFRLGPWGCLLVAAGFAAAVPAVLCAWFVFTGVFADPMAPAGSAACTAVLLAVTKKRRDGKPGGSAKRRGRKSPGAAADAASGAAADSATNTAAVVAVDAALGAAVDAALGEAARAASWMVPAAAQVTVLEAGWKSPAYVAGTTDLHALLDGGRRLLAALEDDVRKGNGMVARAGTDVLVAVFGAAADPQNQARSACRTALAFRAGQSGPRADIRLGIDSGDCALGNLDRPAASGFVVLGEPPEMAARLAALNGRCGTSILVTASVREAVGEELVFRMMHRVRMAGNGKVVRLYELLGRKGRIDGKVLDALEVFLDGVKRFEENDWKRAEAIFRRVQSMKPGDGPARFYIDRCRELAARPDGARWDGVFTLPAR